MRTLAPRSRLASLAASGGIAVPASSRRVPVLLTTGRTPPSPGATSLTAVPPPRARSLFTRASSSPSSSSSSSLRRAYLSTSSRARASAASPLRTYVSLALLLAAGTLGVAYHLDSRAALHRWIAMPVLKATTDPETAQKLALTLLSAGVMPRDLVEDDECLHTELLGMRLTNPICLAAGFDKQAEAVDGLLDLGFGMVEVGSVTPKPQPGNPKPRYFRLSADRGAINRFGFNSDGHDAVLGRLRDRVRRWIQRHASSADDVRVPLVATRSHADEVLAVRPHDAPLLLDEAGVPRGSLRRGQLLAVNLGKNKDSPQDSVADYVEGVRRLAPYADVVVVNISSPNTPGLRNLQRRDVLASLMADVVKARDALSGDSPASARESRRDGAADAPLATTTTTTSTTPPSRHRPPILVKIAPDLDDTELADIADAALASGVEGLIISNTTVSRPASLRSSPRLTAEAGGLSGAPLKPLSLRALRAVRRRVGERLCIVGCGGISSGADALDFARAGADAVELYTSFGYEGVGHPRRVKDELVELLRREGTSWSEVVREARRGGGGGGVARGAEETAEIAEQAAPKLPTAEKPTLRVGGVEERLGEAVLAVKQELQELRSSLGVGTAAAAASAVGESLPAPPRAPLTTTTRRPPRPSSRREDDDDEDAALLDKVHAALGLPPARAQRREDDGPTSAVASVEVAPPPKERRPLTLGERHASELQAALHDPTVAAGVVGARGAAEPAATTTPLGASVRGGGDEEATRSTPRTRLDDVAAAAAAAEGERHGAPRVGMGGPRADLRAVDARRVV